MTTLWEIVQGLGAVGQNDCIYAMRPWTRNASAMRIATGEAGDLLAPVPAQHDYFLETSICREILSDIADWNLSVDEVFDGLVYYAENDAFPTWLKKR